MPVTLQFAPSLMIVPNAETKIEVESEELLFDFRPPSPSESLPFVTAVYHLKNKLPNDEQLMVAFLYLGKTTNLSAAWNGKDISINPADVNYPLNWSPPNGLETLLTPENKWFNPTNGEIYSTKIIYPEGTHASLIPLTIQANSGGELAVHFLQSYSACDKCNNPSEKIFHFTYLLSPARYWASFRNLTVTVIGPADYDLSSEPNLISKGIENGFPVYSSHFSNLPEGEFYFSIKKKGESPAQIPISVWITIFALTACLAIVRTRIIKHIRR